MSFYDGAPSGWDKKFNYPSITGPVSIKDEMDFITQSHGMKDYKHFNQVIVYLKKQGKRVPLRVDRTANCLFESIMRGLSLPQEYKVKHFRRALAVFCARNVEFFWKQYSLKLKQKYGKSHTGVHGGPYSVRSYLYDIMNSSFWGDSICIDMISRMWGLRITVVEHESEQHGVEWRHRHKLPMKDVDIVLLLHGDKYYNAAVHMDYVHSNGTVYKTLDDIPLGEKNMIKVVPHGITVSCVEDAPGREEDDISVVEEAMDEETSDGDYRSWKAHLEEAPSVKREYVSITAEHYKLIASAFIEKQGSSYPDTQKFVCAFCTEQFTSSRTLKLHFETHCEEDRQLESSVPQQGKGPFTGKHFLEMILKHKLPVPSSVTKDFTCETCGKAYKTRDNLQRHIKEKHTENSIEPCTFCEMPFKYKRQKIHHEQNSCLKRKGPVLYRCIVCSKTYKTVAALKVHQGKHKA